MGGTSAPQAQALAPAITGDERFVFFSSGVGTDIGDLWSYHVAIGRNNGQFLGSEKGGQVARRLYSLALSCKQAGVDPQVYLADVLGRRSTTRASDIATLTAWAWAAARKYSARATPSSAISADMDRPELYLLFARRAHAR